MSLFTMRQRVLLSCGDSFLLLRSSLFHRQRTNVARYFSVNSGALSKHEQSVCGKPKAVRVIVTQNLASNASNSSNNASAFIHRNNETRALVENLLQRTQQMMDPNTSNVVAFSGGVDSSLVAALVYKAFYNYRSSCDSNGNSGLTEINGSVQAVLGISNAVPESQIAMARTVANTIGIPLREVPTAEGSDEAYIRNDGHACFVCKTHLYSTLESVANALMKEQDRKHQLNGIGRGNTSVILYNGTNADDTQDPTRLGLIAASNFRVLSPLDHMTKDQVRLAAKYLGLPNWNAAASPCLRSRLAMGVEATERHLKAVEKAEEFVRRVLMLDETRNVRVRMLSGGKAMVELDRVCSDELDSTLRDHGFEELCVTEWGFTSFGGVRGFKTGSVAAMPSTSEPISSRMIGFESRLNV